MRLIRLNDVTSTQPLYHDVRLSQHTTCYVTSTPRPRVCCCLMIGRKPRPNWNIQTCIYTEHTHTSSL